MVADNLQSQGKSTPDAPVDASIWSVIESQLKHPGGDTACYFILNQVRSHCGKNYNCLYRTYHAVMIKLERRFNLPAAIFVAGEMASLAERQGDREAEASAYTNLSRFHGAIGNDRLTIVNLEKALHLFEQTGDQSAVIHTKAAILEQSLNFRKVSEILPEMEALLKQAIENRDTGNINYLHLRLILRNQSAGLYDKMEEHVSAIEKIPLSDPIQPNEYGIAIHAALGRADLFMVKKNYGEAERFYREALRLCEAEPSRWVEIQVLHSLAKLEWERNNPESAKVFLDSAFVKAERLQLHDHLASNFELKAMMAEAEKRYSDALHFTKKAAHHRQVIDSRGAGFNMQNYYLQLEKDQLAAETEKQALELRLRNSQLRNSLIIIALVLVLAAGLFLGLHKQRQGRQALAAQNLLISRQSEQLKSLEAAKSNFFANISHELRTPLTLLLSPIRTLLHENQLTEKQHRLLQIANQGGKELKHLVNEILDLRKLESGKMELYEEPTELSSFFNRYAAQFESLAQHRQVDFSIENAIAAGVVANIDREKCRQVLYNLLSNALKFTPAGGRVRLEVRGEEREVRHAASPLTPHLSLLVSDTGSGIHPDDLPHVFDQYFQTLQPGKPAEGGTGIGLAICHEYAKLFGGKIEVESALGKGSLFRMTFPVRLEENLQPTPDNLDAEDLFVVPSARTGHKNALPATSGAAKPTLLVVEDNPELQEYIRLILQEKYHVVTADNGLEALEVLQSAVPGPKTGNLQKTSDTDGLPAAGCGLKTIGLIISDLMMPVMDGYQLLEKLKSDDATRHIPAIMLTARAEARDKLKALRIGVDDYITKPFDEEELLVRIENLLQNKAARQAEALAATAEDKAATALSGGDRDWLENFETYVRENLDNDLLNVPLLAQKFAMSESTLLRQIKRLTGLPTVQYLKEMRLDKARQLLENGSCDSITQVASDVGYDDVRSFSRSFRQRFGKLPSDFLND